MSNQGTTKVAPMSIRNNSLQVPVHHINWDEVPKRSRGEAFVKNLAVSAALVLCAATLRAGAVPVLTESADVILTAATDNSILDEQLGKLSFVNALFPEAVLVFGENRLDELSLDIEMENVVHTWSAQEPYLAWHAQKGIVYSACDGEVIGIYHGNDDERLVQIMSSSGIACLYGNLQSVLVEIGDQVCAGMELGKMKPGQNCVMEIRKDGRSIDPTPYLKK